MIDQKSLLFFFLFLLLIAQTTEGATTWGFEEHNGPKTWGGKCRNGTRQSPINIKSEWFKSMSHFKFSNYNQNGAVTVANNGHSVVVLGFEQWANQPFITGGDLSTKYLLEQFHFHWEHSLNGSEHSVDGTFYNAELHLVHAKEGISFEEALTHSDGLAVLGIFLQLQNTSRSTSFDTLESALGKVVNAGATSPITAYNVGLHLPTNPSKYFRYNGSLTTPNCDEVAIWTVFADPLPISSVQLELFHAIRGTNGMPLSTNVRLVQKFTHL